MFAPLLLLEIIMPSNYSYSETQRREALARRRAREQESVPIQPIQRPPRVRTINEMFTDYYQEYERAYRRAAGESDRRPRFGRVVYDNFSFTFEPAWQVADKTRLSEWMNIDGEYTPIKDLTLSELKSAIKLLEKGSPCGEQESKIISLKKEFARRTVGRKHAVQRFKKTYPARKGKK